MQISCDEESSGHYLIGITADFNVQKIKIPNFAQLQIGLKGGRLALNLNSGDFDIKASWPTSNKDLMGNQVMLPKNMPSVEKNSSKISHQWEIGISRDWVSGNHKILPIDGFFDQAALARFKPNAYERPLITSQFNIENHHLFISKLNLTPLHQRFPNISDKKKLVLIALFRSSIHQQLPAPLGTHSIPPDTEDFFEFSYDQLRIEQHAEKLLQSSPDSLPSLVKAAELDNDCLRGICFRDQALNDEDLQGYQLEQSNFYAAELKKTNLNHAQIDHANFQHAELSKTKLAGCSLKQTSFRYARLVKAKFSATTRFDKTNFTGADLSKAKLINTQLQGCLFNHARLIWADLRGADLSRADLSDCNLSYADLRNANLTEANLTGAKLTGIKLDSANIKGTIFHMLSLRNVDITKCKNTDQADFEDVFEQIIDSDSGLLLEKKLLKKQGLEKSLKTTIKQIEALERLIDRNEQE